VKKNRFWKLWNANFKASINTRYDFNVNNIKKHADIADYLAHHFKKACSPNDGAKDAKF
jgi:hypothetical protein